MEPGTAEACEEGRYIPRSLLLQWHVTERCNLRCAHCYQESSSGSEPEFEDLLRVLGQFRDLLGVWRREAVQNPPRGHVTVTGGEPFVRGDFLDLCEVLASDKNRFSFAILTNGSYIDASIARRLHRLRPTFVQVSIEGAQATHDQIRGRGDFKRTVGAIKHLVRAGVHTLISFTAHRGNFREFAEVARLGRRLRVARVWADRLVPLGSGLAFREQMLTSEETREFFEIMHKAATGTTRRTSSRWPIPWLRRMFGDTEVAMHRALQFLVAGGKPYHCTAGDSLITVMPNGDVYPCRRMPVRVGNLRETSLMDLYYQSDLLRSLRDRSKPIEGCQRCPHATQCRGGLKCLSCAVTGDPFKADPGCWLVNQ